MTFYMPSEVCPASGCLAVRAGTPELYPLDLHQRLRNPMTRKWHQMPVSQLLNTAWMTCLLTWWRAGCKEDIQDIDLWAKISVEAELQVSGSRCARCKCCCVAVILLFSISVFLCIGIWYSYIHGASNSTIKTTVCLPGCFKSRSNLIYFCMVWNTV